MELDVKTNMLGRFNNFVFARKFRGMEFIMRNSIDLNFVRFNNFARSVTNAACLNSKIVPRCTYMIAKLIETL